MGIACENADSACDKTTICAALERLQGVSARPASFTIAQIGHVCLLDRLTRFSRNSQSIAARGPLLRLH